jgi:hypothetical protein
MKVGWPQGWISAIVDSGNKAGGYPA